VSNDMQAMALDDLVPMLHYFDLPVPDETERWLDVRDQILADLERQSVPVHPREAIEEVGGETTAASIIDRATRHRVDSAERHRISHELRFAAVERALHAIRAEADNIIVAAREGFDEVADVFTDHAELFSPEAGAEEILSQGDEVAAAWRHFRDTGPRLNAYLGLWSDLYGRQANVDTIAATYDGDWWRRVDAEEAFNGPNRWHALVAQGIELRLNTYSEVRQLEADTPPKEMRGEMVYEGGIRGMRMVRG
jgi:hypothetical protein